MVVEYSKNEEGRVLAGKCSIERKQAQQLHRTGFKNYELFIGSHKELEDLQSMKKRLQENYKEFELECVSVHSPNSIISMKPWEVARYIGCCQELADMIEGIQKRKPSGVVLHELRGENYPDFQSKMDAFHEIFDKVRENVNILIEPPIYKANGENKNYLPFPKYLDILVREMKLHKNFGITFDIDHIYESALFHGMRNVYKPISDLQRLLDWNNRNRKLCESFYPGIENYLKQEVGLDTDPKDKKFDKRINSFLEAYGPVLLDYEIEALENFRTKNKFDELYADELEQMFGVHEPLSWSPINEENGGHHFIQGSSKYSEILSRMVGRYRSQIKLLHFTGTDYRLSYLEEESDLDGRNKFDFVKVYGGTIYINSTHTPFAEGRSLLDQQLPLLVYAQSTPIVLEAMLNDEAGKRYFEKGSLLFS